MRVRSRIAGLAVLVASGSSVAQSAGSTAGATACGPASASVVVRRLTDDQKLKELRATRAVSVEAFQSVRSRCGCTARGCPGSTVA